MSRVDTWTLTGVLVFVGAVFPFRAWWDFHHPENWSPGSANDPHVYLWGWAAVAVFIAWVAGRIALLERKRKLRARLKALLVRPERATCFLCSRETPARFRRWCQPATATIWSWESRTRLSTARASPP